MFCYTDQPHIPSFGIGLLKIGSDFIVRPAGTSFREINADGSYDYC